MQSITWHAKGPVNVRLNVLAGVFILAIFIFAVVKYSDQPWTPLRITGVAIALLSLVLLIVARIQLGESFSVRAEGQKTS